MLNLEPPVNHTFKKKKKKSEQKRVCWKKKRMCQSS